MKLIAVGLLAIGVLALVLALREKSPSGSPTTPSPSPAFAPSQAPQADEPQGQQPMVVDQYGNPVDEETAKRILEEMEEDARDAYDHPGKGRGKKKKKRDD